MRFGSLVVLGALATSGCAYDWTTGTSGAGGDGVGGASTSATTSTQTGTGTQATSTGTQTQTCQVADFKSLVGPPCPAGFMCVQSGGCDSLGTCEPVGGPVPVGPVCTCAGTVYPSAEAAAADGLGPTPLSDCLTASDPPAVSCGGEPCGGAGEAKACHHRVVVGGIDSFTCDGACTTVDDPCSCVSPKANEVCDAGATVAVDVCLVSCTR